jgi:prolyl-tRNA editing enzyme YbaK/EbsC (Cys-tRNA(Pro) deacylase)
MTHRPPPETRRAETSPATDGNAPAARLAAVVLAHGLDAEILAPGVPMPTVPSAAAAIGVREDQILKSLLFQDRDSSRFVLAITCGTAKISRDRLAAATGLHRPRLADPPTVLATTGYPAGGVPPIGHATPFLVVVDRRVADLDEAFAGGGAEDLLLRIRPADILRLTNAIVADIIAPTGDPC